MKQLLPREEVLQKEEWAIFFHYARSGEEEHLKLKILCVHGFYTIGHKSWCSKIWKCRKLCLTQNVEGTVRKLYKI